MKNLLCIFVYILLLGSLNAQNTPFNRGVNLTNWFQANTAQQIQFSKYTKTDFEQIKSLGCDVIRLPINLHFMTDGAPNYTLDPLFLNFLDEVVTWAEALDMHLILDNHTFAPSGNTSPSIGNVLGKVWTQMAAHYHDSYANIYYEILNEPHGIDNALWNSIQGEVIKAIRTLDETHYIIVGGAEWNSYNSLASIPDYEDDKLIYTFHFYDPFLFTHQGATWVGIPFQDIGNVPFPYNASAMPTLPASLRGTWGEGAYNGYPNDGTIAQVQALLDIAIQFRNERNVPIYCGEFGVYQPNSEEPDRVAWYDAVRTYLEANDIAWTIWDYHGGFGVFEEGSNGLFEHDLNVPLLEALGFNVPPQSDFEAQPDTEGFAIYTDYLGQAIFDDSYGDGSIDYYSDDAPQEGERCLAWSNSNQYGVIGLDFRPNRDLSYLLENNYYLDFYVRGTAPNTSFDMRFMDTDLGVDDHPWRMQVHIGGLPWNGEWQHLQILLSDLIDTGAWEGQWYESEGKFDWRAIDRFEIVAEVAPLADKTLYFDNIRLKSDTNVATEDAFTQHLQVFPNPTTGLLYINFLGEQSLQYTLFDSLGRLVTRANLQTGTALDLTAYPKGVYFLKVNTTDASHSLRILSL